MTSRHQERRAESRAAIRGQIVAAARALVVEHGMPNVSMSAVAKASGVSRQTLYNHFDDLEQIILAGVEGAIDEAEAHIAGALARAPDPATALEWYVHGSVVAVAGDELAAGAGGGMSLGAEARAMDLLERFHTHLKRIMVEGVADGSFRADLDPDHSSEVLFHMIGATRMLIAHGRDPEEVARQTARLVSAAVRA
ncbi:MAG: TetR/AcrR family transcriptional regulator [Acidimicrobiia bacterium]